MNHKTMRSTISALFLLALGLFVATACAKQTEDFDAGIDYAVLPNPVPTRVDPGKVEVVEMFWYGCPHCYQFEPHIQKWLKNKPEAAEFIRVPATLNPTWLPHARAYYAAESLDAVDKLHEPLFHAIHEQRRRIATEDGPVRFAAAQGIDEVAFTKAMDSFYVNNKLRQSVDLGQKYRLDGVPMVIVNGKYKITGAMAGGYKRMIEIIDYLVAKEAAQSATQ